MKLTWQTSEMVHCLHAAEAWLRSLAQKRCLEPYILCKERGVGRKPKVPDTFFDMDAALAGALTAPVTALLQTLLELGVPPMPFGRMSFRFPRASRVRRSSRRSR